MGIAETEVRAVRLDEYRERDRELTLKSLRHMTAVARGDCERVERKSGYCSLANCTAIHTIRKIGFEVFDRTFPVDDYDFSFFQPLAEAKRLCYQDCASSRGFLRKAYTWLDTVVKSLY